jgi:hypothetical protein
MDVSTMRAVSKLAMAGEQAGFTLEEMIDMLKSGISVIGLLDIIVERLYPEMLPPRVCGSSRWIM